MATKTAKTKKPTGLGISRKGMTITCTWKCGDANYGQGQEFQFWNPATKKWASKTVTTTAKTCSVTFTASKYKPLGDAYMSKVGFRVRGRRSVYNVLEKVEVRRQNPVTGKMEMRTETQSVPVHPSMSDWEPKWLELDKPNVPSVSLTPNETTNGNITMSWSVDTSASDTKPFHSIEWQTRLIKGKNDADFSGVAWTSGTGHQTGTSTSASSSVTIQNDTSLLTGDTSWTRAVRVRSRGPAGTSAWSVVKYYRYAKPYMPVITSASAVEENRGISCTVKWDPKTTWGHPATEYQVKYLIAVPVAGASTYIPPISEWSDAGEPVRDSSGKAGLTFRINDQLSNDEALWFRVVSKYGIASNYTESAVKRASSSLIDISSLPASDLDIDYNSQTQTLTLEADNPSEFPRTSVHVRIRGSNTSVKDRTLKSDVEIPASGTKTITLNLNDYTSVKFETWVESEYADAPKSATTTKYFYPVTQSSNPYAFPPYNLSLSQGSTGGSVDLRWTIRPSNATSAEVSYSTDPDAWDTAGEPYTKVTASSLESTTVTGLDYGTTYYFAVRATNEHGATDWSPRRSITLRQASIPTPTSLSVIKYGKTTLRATWNWVAWADSAEISWADNDKAWDSSDQPTSAIVEKVGGKATFYISGLDRNATWYVRVRYLNGNNKSNPVQKSVLLDVTPVAPADVTLARTSELSTVRVSWTWSWDDAEEAEVMWSDDSGAWTSTEEPSSQAVSRSRRFLDIAGLETGKKWYVRVRFIYGEFSSQSGIYNIDLRTNPDTPVAKASDEAISTDGKTDMSWTYSNEDGTPQASASVFLYNINTGTLGRQVATVDGEATAVPVYGLSSGDNWFVVRTVSTTGFRSELSDPVKVTVLNPPTAEITATSLEDKTIIIDDGETEEEVEIKALTELPLTLTATGAESMTAYIERAEAYFLDRPDERQQKGHLGEVVAIENGTGSFSFDLDNIRGYLDDGAWYRLAVIVKDSIGQTGEASVDFMVAWDHQAIEPQAEVEVDEDEMIVKITPIAPTGAGEGDYCDIYRLSADKPELILSGAEFGETYVDPYPAFGELAGHRIVYRTLYGDFITEDGTLASIDIMADNTDDHGAWIASDRVVIDWDNHRVALRWNIDLSNSWAKDFTETKYLGGSVQGDWNPAISRTGTISAVGVTMVDMDMIEAMRRLAVWDGICHVRTPDGSSFPADVQVTEDRSHDKRGVIPSFNLSITRVDAEGFDMMTLAQWEADHD